MSDSCKACGDVRVDAINAACRAAADKRRSWNSVKTEFGYADYRNLQNHFDRHVNAVVEYEREQELGAAEAELKSAIDDAVTDLFAQMRIAPAEVKPLYAAAIRNLQGLADTKPSQQHLIQALKTIQEMTGMKQEQRMMLSFAEAMFKSVEAPKKIPSLSNTVLELTAVESAEEESVNVN